MTTHRFDPFRGRACLIVGALAALLACQGCTMAQGGGPTEEKGPISATSVAEPVAQTIAILGTTHSSEGTALQGVTVCTRPGPAGPEDSLCTTSDPDGVWFLKGVPALAFVAITFTKEGYFPALYPMTTATVDMAMPEEDGTLVASR